MPGSDKAKQLSAMLAIECVRLALPELPLLRPEDLMEFRADNNAALRGFRRSMLRYAGDLNGKVANVPPAEIQAATKFFVDTEIVPALDELRAKMNAPARPWYKRAVDFGRVLPKVVSSFFTMNPSTIIGSILTNYAGEFFTELSAVGEKRESLKKSGLRCSRSTIRPRPAICRSVWANISSGGNSGPLIRKPRNTRRNGCPPRGLVPAHRD